MRMLKDRTMICPNCGEDIYFTYENPGYADGTFVQRWHCPMCHQNGWAEVLNEEKEALIQEMWDVAASELEIVESCGNCDDNGMDCDPDFYNFTGTYKHGCPITISISLNTNDEEF